MNIVSQIPFTEALISVTVQPGEQKAVKYKVSPAEQLLISQYQVRCSGFRPNVQVYFDGKPVPDESDLKVDYGCPAILADSITLECKNNEGREQTYTLVVVGAYIKLAN